MSKGTEVWKAALQQDERGGVRSTNAMRFYALAKMLAEAETAWLTGSNAQAVERLSELEDHTARMRDELTAPALGKAA